FFPHPPPTKSYPLSLHDALPIFLGRVRARLHVAAQADTALENRIGRILALRAAEVRWGPEARDEFLVRNSADVRTAIGYFAQLRSEEHTSELQSRGHLVCRLLLE